MNELSLNPKTRQQLANFQTSPGQAIVVIGQSGVGKGAISQLLAAHVLNTTPAALDTHPYIKHVTSVAGKMIGIEEIRELESFLYLKVPSRTAINRVVVIEDAQRLSLEAQNALLKTLEEPPQSTLIIMTTNRQQALLPTVRSRMQTLTVAKPTKQQLENFFAGLGFSTAAITRSYSLSGGLPGLTRALLEETDHPLIHATETARKLLQASLYERLLTVDELAKQRDVAEDTCFILQQMAHVSLQTASSSTAERWQHVLAASYQASELLASGAQAKLVVTNLMLNLS